MIEAIIKYSGPFINKPKIVSLSFKEDEIAMERKNDDGKFEQITVGNLFDAYISKASYVLTSEETQYDIPKEYFDIWFRGKYLKNTTMESRLISIQYFKR